MNVLAIDSSNHVMGVAILKDETVLGELTTNVKKNHSVRLMPAIEQLAADVGLVPGDLDRIVVAEGPGSYTGVRIGVSIAKMLAWSLDAELVGVSSLEILAQNGRYFNGLVMPFFDARRGRVYTSLYGAHGEAVTRLTEDQVVPLTECLTRIHDYGERVLFLGTDLSMHQETIKKEFTGEKVFGAGGQNLPRAAELGRLGMQKKPVDNIHLFTPEYRQLAEAEANWQADQGRQK